MARACIERGSNAYWRAIVVLFLGSVAAFGAEYCLQPIIPVLAGEFGLTPATASLAMSFGTAGMAFSMIVIAAIARRLERKITMTVAITVASLLALGMSVSSNFGLILLLRLCQGILLAGFPALAIAYINEEFDDKMIGLVVGIYVSGNALGGLAGRLFISTVTDYFSWRWALGTAGVIYLAIGIMFWLALPNPVKVRPGREAENNFTADLKILLSNRKLLQIYAVAFAAMGAFVCTYNYISYVFIAPPYNLSQTAIGFIFTMYLVGTVSSAVMGGLSDRYGNGLIMCLSGLIMLAGILLTLAISLPLKIVGLGFFTYGFFGCHCAACGWAGKVADGDKAQASSMYMLFYYMGASVIGTLGGAFLSNYGWAGVVAFVGAMVAVVICVSIRLTDHFLPSIRAITHRLH